MTHIQTSDEPPWFGGCRGWVYATSFHATNVNGKRVSGVVCTNFEFEGGGSTVTLN